jgi:hypothetical protein
MKRSEYRGGAPSDRRPRTTANIAEQADQDIKLILSDVIRLNPNKEALDRLQQPKKSAQSPE